MEYGKSLRKLRERVVDEQADLMVCSSIRVWSWTRVEVAMFLALVNQLTSLVRISWLRRERIDRFLFSGANSYYSKEQRLARDSFHAHLICSIIKQFGNLKGSFFVLTLSDQDMQRLLVMNSLESSSDWQRQPTRAASKRQPTRVLPAPRSPRSPRR